MRRAASTASWRFSAIASRKARRAVDLDRQPHAQARKGPRQLRARAGSDRRSPRDAASAAGSRPWPRAPRAARRRRARAGRRCRTAGTSPCAGSSVSESARDSPRSDGARRRHAGGRTRRRRRRCDATGLRQPPGRRWHRADRRPRCWWCRRSRPRRTAESPRAVLGNGRRQPADRQAVVRRHRGWRAPGRAGCRPAWPTSARSDAPGRRCRARRRRISVPRWRSRAHRMALKVAIDPPVVNSPRVVSGNPIQSRSQSSAVASSCTSAGAAIHTPVKRLVVSAMKLARAAGIQPAARHVGQVARGGRVERARDAAIEDQIEQRLRAHCRLPAPARAGCDTARRRRRRREWAARAATRCGRCSGWSRRRPWPASGRR